ncbi:MAG: cell division protein FtsZ [Gammaproteobacteria bacterium]
MTMKFLNTEQAPARIRVVGVGGCGGNIIRHLQEKEVPGIEYAAVNTDSQALSLVENAECVQIGGSSGLGAGADPEIARQAAENDKERLTELVRGYDMVFIVSGMGKGTGTGASPIVARLAREQEALTVAVATLPFSHERRDAAAEKGLQNLTREVNSLLVVPNAKLSEVLGEDAAVPAALAAANDVLHNAVRGISEIITKPGEMNLDFKDVRSVMSVQGKAVMGSASKSGEDRAAEAAHEALCCPIMEDINWSAATHFLVNVTASPHHLKLSEMDAVHQVIDEKAPHCHSERFVGLVYDKSMGEAIRVTIIATGIDERQPAVETASGPPSLKVIEANMKDDAFTSGRVRKQKEDICQKHGGNVKAIPAILRAQRN